MEQEPTNMVYSEEQYLSAVRDNSPATTQEVADTVGVTRQGADYRLRSLEENGKVSSKMLGNTLIWTAESGPERHETPPETPADVSHPEPEPMGETARTLPLGLLERDVYGESIPNSVDRDDLLEAIVAARDYLEENGRAQKNDFVRNVMPEHPLKYDADAALETLDAGERYRGKWWRLIRAGLKSLDDAEKPPNPADPWEYTGGVGE